MFLHACVMFTPCVRNVSSCVQNVFSCVQNVTFARMDKTGDKNAKTARKIEAFSTFRAVFWAFIGLSKCPKSLEQNHYHSIENIDSIVWTASENGTAYIYIDLTEEDEILKLVAKGRVNISELACCTVYENPFYRMTYKYDDRTYEGTITSCEYVTTTYPNEPGPDSDDGFLLDEPLFGYLNTYCRRDVGNALLFYSVFDQSYEENGELHRVERIVSLVRVRGCSDAIYEVGDYDGDGENELIVEKYRSGLRYAYYDEPEGGVTKLLTEAEYQEMTAQ